MSFTENRPLSTLIALGQLDFALAREQRDGAHLAQVHTNGVVGLIADVLGEIQIAEFVRVVLLFEVDFGLFEYLDARAVKIGKKIFKLAAGIEILGEQLVHFVV